MKTLSALLLLAFTSMSSLSAAGLEFEPADSIAAILSRQAGQVVELRLRTGEKIGGKVEKVGDKLVHLTQLSGQEFFEAAVALDQVAAVVVRTKAK